MLQYIIVYIYSTIKAAPLFTAWFTCYLILQQKYNISSVYPTLTLDGSILPLCQERPAGHNKVLPNLS